MSGNPYPTAPQGGYPTQPQMGAYPTAYPQTQYPAGQYPYQQQAYGAPGMAYNPPPYQSAPPPYQQYPAPATSQYAPPPPAMYGMPQPQTVVAPGLFDQGARFDGVAGQRIPPPPPGVAPNAAQLASMQGHTVIGTQERSNWMTGGGRNDPGINWGF